MTIGGRDAPDERLLAAARVVVADFGVSVLSDANRFRSALSDVYPDRSPAGVAALSALVDAVSCGAAARMVALARQGGQRDAELTAFMIGSGVDARTASVLVSTVVPTSTADDATVLPPRVAPSAAASAGPAGSGRARSTNRSGLVVGGAVAAALVVVVGSVFVLSRGDRDASRSGATGLVDSGDDDSAGAVTSTPATNGVVASTASSVPTGGSPAALGCVEPIRALSFWDEDFNPGTNADALAVDTVLRAHDRDGCFTYAGSRVAAVERLSTEIAASACERVTDADCARVIFTVGLNGQEAVRSVAPSRPGTEFVILDDRVDSPLDNVTSAVVSYEEGAFMAGAAAALRSQSGHVAFMGGISGSGFVKAMEANFVAGVQAVAAAGGPTVVVESRLSDDLLAPDAREAVRSRAAELYESGVDVIFGVYCSGEGLMSAATERRLLGAPVWVIGIGPDVETGRDLRSLAGPERDALVLMSVLIRPDVVAKGVVAEINDGTHRQGVTSRWGMTSGAVTYTLAPDLPNDVVGLLDEFRGELAAGTLSSVSTYLSPGS